jgi:peptide/nickel transport system substrate-binding protein
MNMRRRSLLAGTATLLATRPAAAQAPSRARTLVIAQNFDPTSLWPNATTASDNINAGAAITESLFWIDPRTNQAMPLLAEGFIVEGPNSVRIALRPNIRFANGEPMDADAVVHSLKLFLDAKTTPAYAIYTAALDGVEKIDERTVRLRTKHPYPAIGLVLAQVFVVPPKYWASVGAAGFGQKPVGTGPFRLTEWVKDSRLVMDRNPDYWGQAPAGVERLVWRPVPDDTARAAGLMAGEFDLTSALAITDVPQVEADPKLQVAAAPSFRIYTIILSSLAEHPSPLQDHRVRQALNHAVDKDSLVKNVLFGRARILSGQLLRREQPGFDPEVKDYGFDPVRARSLLAEAGHPNGFEIVFKFPSGRYAQDREVSEAVAGMLAKIGVRTRMAVLEPGEFLRQLRQKELQPMAFVGLAPPDDPDFQVSQYRSTWRYSYVKNEKIDALIDAGAQEMNPQKRAATYRSLMRLMHEEAPVIFLYQGVDSHGMSRRVRGFVPSGDSRIQLSGVSLAT